MYKLKVMWDSILYKIGDFIHTLTSAHRKEILAKKNKDKILKRELEKVTHLQTKVPKVKISSRYHG